jgi:hypothetical protein
MDKEQSEIWLPVIGKSLAILAMHQSEFGNSEVAIKVGFLDGLGVPREDIAAMIGSTTDSVRVMLSTRKHKKGAKRGKNKKDWAESKEVWASRSDREPARIIVG